MIRKGIRPRFRLALDVPGNRRGLRMVMPFRRSWIAIAILAAFDVVFLIPAVTTFREAAAGWAGFEDLFDLVGAVFLSAWLLGWSIGPLVMTTVLALMLFGREVVTVRDDTVEIFLGLPLLGVTARYQARAMRNLRLETPPKKSGKSWRGTHLGFDYGANTLAMGSNMSAADLADLERAMETATGRAVREGEATRAELEGNWEPDALHVISSPGASPDPVTPAVAEPVSLVSPSALALVAANLVPLFGAALLGWNLSDVMVLYWAESAVIGFFNVCKMAVISRWLAIPAGIFFCSHFGAFMAVHFLFIYGLFVQGPGDFSGGDLAAVAQLFRDLWPALAALFLSHGISFYQNFLGRREYHGRTLKQQMSEPYTRIVFMHLVLIFGGWGVLLLGGPTPVLLLVIALKIWFDVKAHLKQHREPGSPTGRGDP